MCVYILVTKHGIFEINTSSIRQNSEISRCSTKVSETPRQKRNRPNETSGHKTKTAEILRLYQNFPRRAILKVPFATPSVDIVFVDETMDIKHGLRISDDIFLFQEGNRDTHNSPYTVIDKVDVSSGEDDEEKFYVISQADVDRLEQRLKGGPNSDVD